MNGSTQRGFTLIEVMVVVVILAILGTLVAPKLIGRTDDARRVKAQQDLRALEAALELYKLDNLAYPTTDQGLEALVTAPAGGGLRNGGGEGYLKRLPNDPWGRPYLYLSPGEHGEVDIFTLGADGREGGEGNAADLGNWSLR